MMGGDEFHRPPVVALTGHIVSQNLINYNITCEESAPPLIRPAFCSAHLEEKCAACTGIVDSAAF